MATPRVIDLDGFDKKRYPKALAQAYPFKLRGQVVALTDADTVEVFLDQAFGDNTTVSVRIANISAAEKRSRDPVEKGLGIAAWAEAQDILYPGRPVGLTSLKPLEPFGTSLGRVLGLIELDENGLIKDYAELMLGRKKELAAEGIELGVWPSEEWPFEGMPPRSKSAGIASLRADAIQSGDIDQLSVRTRLERPSERLAATGTADPGEQTERLATIENHARAKEMGRTTPQFGEERDEPMRSKPMGSGPLGSSSHGDSDIGSNPLRDSADRTSNLGASYPQTRPGPQPPEREPAGEPPPTEGEPVSLKTEPTRIINLAVVAVILLVQGAGIIISDEEVGLIQQGVEILVEIAAATGLLQYLRTRVWSEASHKQEVRQALYKAPPVR